MRRRERRPPPTKFRAGVSERPIPVAGFNLGKYVRAEAMSGNIPVQAYGTKGVENRFPKRPRRKSALRPIPAGERSVRSPSLRRRRRRPRCSGRGQQGSPGNRELLAVVWPLSYGSLALTQMPGNLSQGWPGLVFLSSFAFLSPQEQSELHFDPLTRELNDLVLVHEPRTSGGAISCSGRAIAISGLPKASPTIPPSCCWSKTSRAVPPDFEQYRRDLVSKNEDGEWLGLAGPVTLGSAWSRRIFPAATKRPATNVAPGSFTCCVACSAMPCSTILNLHPFPKSAPESRRALLPCPAQNPGTLCREKHQHRGTDPRFRRGTAAPTLVRASSPTRLVSRRLDRRHRDSKTRSARHSPRRQVRHHHRHRHDHTKGRARRSRHRRSRLRHNCWQHLGFSRRSAGRWPRDCLPPDRPRRRA